MPARQDQTLQIFLIILIFLSLVLMVATYLGWRSYSEANQRAASLQNQLNDEKTRTSNQQVELEDLREMMGFGRNDNTADVKTAFKNDMDKMGAGIADAETRSYRKVLEVVFLEGQKSAANEADLKQKLNDRTKELQAVQSQKEAQLLKFEEAMKKAQAEAAEERNRFDADRKQLETTKAELQKTLEQQRANYEKQITDRDAQIKSLTDKVTKLERDVVDLRAQIRDEPGNFEVADGRISWVNQNGTVWINLGTADALRRQVSFSVYDADQHDADKTSRKGSIEVTRLLGEHLAEARITEETPTNPIMTGDRIYSQVWHRGKKLRFALTGFIDFDGDGKSDADLARELIELNDGIVDAYVTPEGKIVGEITAKTHYLVRGDLPELATQTALQQAYNDMTREATALGVRTISIHDFLNQMGYAPRDRTVPLEEPTAVDFPARPRSGNAPTPTSTRFRPRAPQRTPADTAR